MRQHDVGNVSDALGAFGVLLVDVIAVDELLFRLGGADCLLVHNSCACAVDQHRALLHEGKKPGIDHAARGVVLRDVKADDVRLRENILDAAELDAKRFRHVGGKHGVECENGHFETGNAFRKQSSDVAESEDAEGFAGDLVAHEFGLFPFPRAGGLVGGHQFAVCGKRQGDNLLGNGVGIRPGGVHHVDVAPPGIFRVDVVITGAGADHELELRQLIHHFGRDFFASHNHNLGVGIFLRKIQNRFVRHLNDFKTGIRQNFGDHFVQFCRNQNFLHKNNLRIVYCGHGKIMNEKIP